MRPIGAFRLPKVDMTVDYSFWQSHFLIVGMQKELSIELDQSR